MKTRREIMLVMTGQGLMAHNLINGAPDPQIVRLFGTHILPTPYRSGATMADAAAEITRLNPGVVVSTV